MGASMRGVTRIGNFGLVTFTSSLNDLKFRNVNRLFHSFLLSFFGSLLFLRLLPPLFLNILLSLLLSLLLLILLNFFLFLFLPPLTFLRFSLRLNSLRNILLSNIFLFGSFGTSNLRGLDSNFRPLRLWLSKLDTLLRGLLLDLCEKNTSNQAKNINKGREIKSLSGENLYKERRLLVFPTKGIRPTVGAETTPAVVSLLALFLLTNWAATSSSSTSSSSCIEGVAPASGLREPALPELLELPAPVFTSAVRDKPSSEPLIMT
ncbi:hypothetical protein Hdeb2414_s0002g00072051 [Helianthus debilis subsp. tardiflorus]